LQIHAAVDQPQRFGLQWKASLLERHCRQEKFFFFVDSGKKSGIECKASLIVASFFCSVRPPVGFWADKNGFFNKLQPISVGV
jgi:hypothetical protein